MLERVFRLQATVDVYISPAEVPSRFLITFHRMTTRERIELVAGENVVEFLALINGKDSIEYILKELGGFSKQEASKLVDFLVEQHLITDTAFIDQGSARYSRQSIYFDDMVLDRSGVETQDLLESKNVVVLGCGRVGSQIAEILVRAGIKNLTLVDYKKISRSNLQTHLFTRLENLDGTKVNALHSYLIKINSKVKVKVFTEKLVPETDLSNWIDDSTSLVINSCDEPYIGHTSLKIGRFLQPLNIPLYVSGGFDAHLMSSGELVYPPFTPCIDCVQQSFNLALSNWKPVYNREISHKDTISDSQNIDTHDVSPLAESHYSENEEIYSLVGGAGGLIMMSSFSANLSAIKIIQVLTEDSANDFKSIRYEYIPNSGQLTEFEMERQAVCNVCSK